MKIVDLDWEFEITEEGVLIINTPPVPEENATGTYGRYVTTNRGGQDLCRMLLVALAERSDESVQLRDYLPVGSKNVTFREPDGSLLHFQDERDIP